MDVAGNTRDSGASSTITYFLPPPIPTDIDLADASDTSNSVDGTDTDNITSATDWTITGNFVPREDSGGDTTLQAVRLRISTQADKETFIGPTVDIDTDADSDTNDEIITFGDVVGCADEEGAPGCTESNDVSGSFNYTFDVSDDDTFPDGTYTIHIQTIDVSNTASGTAQIDITKDTTAPVTAGFSYDTATLSFIADSHSSPSEAYFTNTSRPEAKAALELYDGNDQSSTTPIVTDVRDQAVWTLTDTGTTQDHKYDFIIVDAAGNKSAKIPFVTPQDVRVVKIRDQDKSTNPDTKAQYAAVSVTTDTTSSNTMQFAAGLAANACKRAASVSATYQAGAVVEQDIDRVGCFEATAVYDQGTVIVYRDVVGAPDLAEVALLAEHDTTEAGWKAGNDTRFTQIDTPTIEGTTLPDVTTKVYQVTKTAFDAASDVNDATLRTTATTIFEGKSGAADGSFTIPQTTALAEDTYIVIVELILNSNPVRAKVLEYTVDKTAPDVLPSAYEFQDANAFFTGSKQRSIFSRLSVGFASTLDTVRYILTIGGVSQGLRDDFTGAYSRVFDFTSDPNFPSGVEQALPTSFTVVDRAGNRTTHSVGPYVLDDAAPEIVIIDITGGKFIAVATDGIAGTITMKQSQAANGASCSAASHATTTYTPPAEITRTDAGSTNTNDICFSATDAAGNVRFLNSDDAIQGAADLRPQASDDSGVSSTDKITNVTNPTIVGQTAPNIAVRLFYRKTHEADGTAITSPTWEKFDEIVSDSTGIVSAQETLTEGTYDLGATVNPSASAVITDTADAGYAAYDGGFVPSNPVKTGDITIDTSAPTGTNSVATLALNSSTTSATVNGETVINDTTPTFDLTYQAALTEAGLYPYVTIGQTTIFSTSATALGETSGTVTGTVTQDGSYTAQAGFADTAGNRANPSATLDIVLDTVAPTYTFEHNSRSRFIRSTRDFASVISILLQDRYPSESLTLDSTLAFVRGDTTRFDAAKVSSTRFTTVPNAITSIIGSAGGPINLDIPALSDAVGNSVDPGSSFTGFYVDKQAPSIDADSDDDGTDEPIEVEAIRTSNMNFSLSVNHNQLASNDTAETLTPVFAGNDRCVALTASTVTGGRQNTINPNSVDGYISNGQAPSGVQDYTFIINRRARSGAYSGCTVLLRDEAGNRSNTVAIADFRVPSSSGGGGTGLSVSAPTVSSIVTVPTITTPEGVIVFPDEPQQTEPQPQVVLTFTQPIPYATANPRILQLQRFLNAQGYTVSVTGPGSQGQETSYFGPATRRALIRFQQANGLAPTGELDENTRAELQKQAGDEEVVSPQPQQQLINTLRQQLQALQRQVQELLNRAQRQQATTPQPAPITQPTPIVTPNGRPSTTIQPIAIPTIIPTIQPSLFQPTPVNPVPVQVQGVFTAPASLGDDETRFEDFFAPTIKTNRPTQEQQRVFSF